MFNSLSNQYYDLYNFMEFDWLNMRNLLPWIEIGFVKLLVSLVTVGLDLEICSTKLKIFKTIKFALKGCCSVVVITNLSFEYN